MWIGFFLGRFCFLPIWVHFIYENQKPVRSNVIGSIRAKSNITDKISKNISMFSFILYFQLCIAMIYEALHLKQNNNYVLRMELNRKRWYNEQQQKKGIIIGFLLDFHMPSWNPFQEKWLRMCFSCTELNREKEKK